MIIFTLTDEVITFDQAMVLKEILEGFLGGVVIDLKGVKHKDQALSTVFEEIREQQEKAGRYLKVLNDE
ncbi:MAG: hypothetical protein GY754_27180 [bacterium]|nr:hypothetical protein [bacterium]